MTGTVQQITINPILLKISNTDETQLAFLEGQGLRNLADASIEQLILYIMGEDTL